MRVSLRILTLLVALLAALPSMLHAQTAEEKARIAEQRRIVEQLEKEVEASEKALSAIKKDKSTAQQRVRNITKQINSRNQLLTRTEREIGSIERNITLNDSLIRKTDAEITTERERYAEMVREAHRNYKQNNYITYLLASQSFTDVARRIANIRAMAVLRSEGRIKRGCGRNRRIGLGRGRFRRGGGSSHGCIVLLGKKSGHAGAERDNQNDREQSAKDF